MFVIHLKHFYLKYHVFHSHLCNKHKYFNEDLPILFLRKWEHCFKQEVFHLNLKEIKLERRKL